MLTPLDESPWHQSPTTFDHVVTSDPRFFDRLWFAASDRRGQSALQFTLGVYQNMNVVDGGFVAIVDGRQYNLRVSRELRPRYVHDCGPLRIEAVEPLQRLRLGIAPNASRAFGRAGMVGHHPGPRRTAPLQADARQRGRELQPLRPDRRMRGLAQSGRHVDRCGLLVGLSRSLLGRAGDGRNSRASYRISSELGRWRCLRLPFLLDDDARRTRAVPSSCRRGSSSDRPNNRTVFPLGRLRATHRSRR